MEQVARRSGGALPAAIGRYRILSRLGKGAMGVVYCARDEQMDRDVALKVMMADLDGEPETRTRFFREAQITSKLLHRNIVTVFDMGEDDGRPFIVMELLKGRTLTEFLKEADRGTLEQKLELMVQTCEGLSVAHAKGVVHRDIKPGNLFVQVDGGLKILDFGVARLSSSNMTASGLIVGTPDYMSPEQARGREVDARSDIFSAAAVFYFMVTGRKPFEGPDLPVVLQRVVRDDPLPIREQEAPAPLARIIARALSKEPERRYQKAADMAADLVRFKRYFDTESRHIGTAARERFDEIVRTTTGIREVRAALELAPSTAVDEEEAAVRERFPYFCAGPDGQLPIVVPFRRSRLNAMMNDLQAVLDPLAADLPALGIALSAVERGERALESQDGRTAVGHFERASQILAAESPRVARGRGRARELFSDQQARVEKMQSLFTEARAAERIGRWDVVSARCAEILVIDPQASDASRLAAKAGAAAAAEAEARNRRVSQLVAQATPWIQSGRFDRGERLILEALAADPANEAALAAQARLNAARWDAETRAADARRAADEAAAARRAADAARQERAKAHATEAESRWTTGDVAEALRLAELALSLERAAATALRIQGLARARLREQAEAAARAADASARVARAAELLTAGKFEKAAREARKALDLDPGRGDAANLITEARKREVEFEAARQQEAAARDRDRQIDKMLKTARAALNAGEPSRAAYTAENALLVHPGHQQAEALLSEARAAVAAAAEQEAEGTVRLKPDGNPTFDPDDTAVVGQRAAGIKELAMSLGDWASGLRRRLQSPRE